MLKQAHTILVVDDDPVSLKMLERLLRGRFRVITSSDPQAALELLRTEKISLVLSDQNMPGMSGTEFLRKSREINEHIVRIVVTSSNDSQTFVDSIKTAGAISVIHKPWDPKKVERAILDALSRHELLTENRQAMSQMRQANKELRRVVKRR